MKGLLVALLVLVLVLSGCGSKEPEETTTEPDDNVSVDVDTGKDSTVVKVENGTEIEVAHEGAKSLDIPEDYPQDLMPLYSEEFILSVQQNPDGSYAVIGLTNDSLDQVKDFYSKHLEGGTVAMTQQDAESYMSGGDINGSAYTVMIQPSEDDDYDYATMFMVSIMPGQSIMGDTETTEAPMEEAEEVEEKSKPSVAAPIVVPEGLTMPEAYPEDIMPVYPTGNTQLATTFDGMIAIMSEDSPEDVMDFYKELLKDAPDFSEMNMPPASMMMGTLDGKNFQVIIGPNDGQEEERFKSLIQIVYP